MILRGQTTILVCPTVVSNCTLIDAVRRFRMKLESSSGIQYWLLLRKLEESRGLFSVLSFAGLIVHCDAESEPSRKWH